ncbi:MULTISPECIES: ABC transporter ATP-binding protein [Corynebacterium]|uniref:ABC transporter ATP-binding protein n=1 Tax=Corynebacterium TaxID=1716 RepID=UPI0009B65BED|nr:MULTISPECIES: ABC transporter ATP-binding protein [Corynebacterium]QQU92513.1 ABC transporter ATP-binding protein [Corynebacterium aurimucosum]
MYAEKGECIGILGRNGSGKSTLMRLIAGNEAPDEGQVLTSATPTLLNVSAALQPRLPGRTNIRLGLLAQGVSPEKIDELTEEIIDFAEIGKAVERPMKTYSSGMGARLKFAISTAVQRDLLLIDEALGTGDASFTERAQERMTGFLSNAGTIFLVSHAMASIKSMCSRVIWLHDGEIIADGDVEPITLLYNKWTARAARKNFESAESLILGVKSTYKKPSILLDSQVSKLLN